VRAKRVLDVTVAAAVLVVLGPIVIGVIVAIAVSMLLVPRDRGPVLYGEPRISAGRTFRLLKFRTLRVDVLAEMRRAGSHARLFEADATNLTWAGRRLLKPWYLDELPQLVNVLRGEMSLVGPRAWPPPMVETQVAGGHDYRLRLPAGLTGPAQVTKGSGRTYLGLDLEYAEACGALGGLALVRRDLRILLETVRVMARGEGLSY
jgi:lipopolysaccharide/colanic/teichoic acid biosynthesis glycosyltransferase